MSICIVVERDRMFKLQLCTRLQDNTVGCHVGKTTPAVLPPSLRSQNAVDTADEIIH